MTVCIPKKQVFPSLPVAQDSQYKGDKFKEENKFRKRLRTLEAVKSKGTDAPTLKRDHVVFRGGRASSLK
ncbi:hypothetical protein K474DRAFT_1096035 [Panus rudis PR-1116 ss-1]|nr:hypothetical protein K474DRAFT_1096035 [Panus rudis PR-1116 ss-1]